MLRIIPVVICSLMIIFSVFASPVSADSATLTEADKSVMAAMGAMWTKDYSEADAILTRLLKTPIDSEETKAKALQIRARAREGLGRVTEAKVDGKAAEDIWTKLIDEQPDSVPFHYFRGLARRSSGNFQGSLDDLAIPLKATPGNPDLLKEIEETKRKMRFR